MKKILYILAMLLATTSAVLISGGKHTDISSFGVGSSSSGGYGSSDASGLSGGYNTMDNSAFGVGYISDYNGSDGSHSYNTPPSATSPSANYISANYISVPTSGYNTPHSSGIDVGGYSRGHHDNIKTIRVIHEFMRTDHGRKHGKNYGSKGAVTYKLIHDYGHNNNGGLGYSYLSTSGHGQSSEEPTQIIKVIHEKSTPSSSTPHSGPSYAYLDQSNFYNKGSSSSHKGLGTFSSLGFSGSYSTPSISYSTPQLQYLPPLQEYFPPTTSAGGYKYKQK